MKVNMDEKPTLNELTVLEHHGVKGMRWGVRNAVSKVVVGKPDASGVTRRDKREAARATNKTTRRAIEDFHDQKRRVRDADIKAARENLKKANREYSDTKSALKAQRTAVGKNATKIALKEARAKNYQVSYKAHQDTTGEAAVKAAIQVGAHVAAAMAEKRRQQEQANATTSTS